MTSDDFSYEPTDEEIEEYYNSKYDKEYYKEIVDKAIDIVDSYLYYDFDLEEWRSSPVDTETLLKLANILNGDGEDNE